MMGQFGFTLLAFLIVWPPLAVGLLTGYWRDALTWWAKSLAVFLVGIPVTLLGYPMVALALPFRVEHPNTTLPFTDSSKANGRWMLITLPVWARPWDNVFDGMWGDKRGWWNDYCLTNYGKPCSAFYSMWQWAAVRNPANYWSRVTTGLDISRCTLFKLAGDDVVEELPGLWQWQFLVAIDYDGKRYHRLFCVFPWFFRKDKAVMIDIGWKFKLSHSGMSMDAPVKDRIRGSVFTPSPWKQL